MRSRKGIDLFALLPAMLLAFLLLSCSSGKEAPPSEIIARTPPMGWNSWNCFGVTVNEAQVRANADYMAEHLKEYGWEYVVVDLGWYLPPELNTATFKMENPPQSTDRWGRLVPDARKFPSSADGKGFKPLADYVHSLGLKFGIHIMRGVPWQAVEGNMPVWGTSLYAASFADKSDTCEWYDGMYGVDVTSEGGREYYNSLVELYAQWGVDYIKADDISFPYHAGEIAAIHKAIEKSGRPIVLSLSPGAAPLGQVSHLQHNANLWRISPDFWDHWKFLKHQFELCRMWQPHITEGHWPDADMLPLGKLRVTGPDDYVAENMGLSMEEITDEYSRFTDEEKYTLMSLWCIFRSPLMMGGHMPENDELTLKLLTNREALEINQSSVNNRELKREGDKIVWSAESADGESVFVALFNTGDDNAVPVEVDWEELGIAGKRKVRDIWDGNEIGTVEGKLRPEIKPHEGRLFKIY